MKKAILTALVALLAALQLVGQAGIKADELVYTNAQNLTVIGKEIASPGHPYHRADISAYPFTSGESKQLIYPSGICIGFRTNSTILGIKVTTGAQIVGDRVTPDTAKHGFDTYINDEGQWRYVGTTVNGFRGNDDRYAEPLHCAPQVIRRNLPEGYHDYLVYLPLFTEVVDLEIGVQDGKIIVPLAGNPFRHKIVVCGSSVSQGVGATRAGVPWASRIARETGLYMVNLSLSGNCKLQRYVAEMLTQVEDVDAFVLDVFNNPTSGTIKSNFEPFVKILREKYPKTPIIFLSNHRRSCLIYDDAYYKSDRYKYVVAQNKVEALRESDPNVYWVDAWLITGEDGYAQGDGVHPDGLGYYRWAEELTPILLKILKKYKIK